MTHKTRRSVGRLCKVVLIAGCLAGCRSPGGSSRFYQNPYAQTQNLAVTVFRNQSGSESLDTMAVTDEFYAELQRVPGFEVIAVNRLLAAMDELDISKISGPEDIAELSDLVGADAMIIGAVTHYDPYPPPRMAMAIQLYRRGASSTAHGRPAGEIQPSEIARAGQPFVMGTAEKMRPQSMVVKLVDAAEKETVERIKQYATSRTGEQKPYGWKRYTTQRNFLGFVSHELIWEMLSQERARLLGTTQRVIEEQEEF